MAITNLTTEPYIITFTADDDGFFWGETHMQSGRYRVVLYYPKGTYIDDIRAEFEGMNITDLSITIQATETIIY